jgi:serine/threonine protein kinase
MIRCLACQAENDDNADNCIACGKGLYALTRGAVLSGRYKILDAIGKGGMGVVYKVHDLELDETIAIKIVRSDLANSDEALKRFRSEIKLARRVTHPNVCRIHDCGREGHLTYIAMELVIGTDLKGEVRRRGGLAPEEALDIAVQVAHGLDAVHRQHVVHRDLKTPNIMRMADGTVKLMDFGIAKSLAGDATTGATATGSVLGTPEYMSPEQAQGMTVDARSDIYALGIVLFELLTGELPFRGDTPMATLLKQVQEPPPLDGPRAARIPPSLVPVLRKALAKDPADRYPSAREMAAALAGTRVALATNASPSGLQPTQCLGDPTGVPSTTLTPVTRPRRRMQWLAWAGVAVAAAVAAAVTTVGLLSARRDLPRDVATVPTPQTAARLPAAPTPAPAATLQTSAQKRPSPAALAHSPAMAPQPPRLSAPKKSATPALTVSPAATPASTPSAASAPPESGMLRVDAKPYAEVFVDGNSLGKTPVPALALPVGAHTVRLVHPAFQPLQRKFTVRAGDRVDISVDLALDAIPK